MLLEDVELVVDNYEYETPPEGSGNETNITYPVVSYHLHEEDPPFYIIFIFVSCAFGAILRILLRIWASFVSEWKWGSLIKLPYTVFLLLVGMAIAAIGIAYPEQVQPYLLSEMDPELFLHVFLPVVIFESAYVIDIHVFWRSIGHVSLLAVPGLLLATGLTAALSLVLPEISEIDNVNVKAYVALIFGAIISATDPVAVVALLKELGCQKHLSIIIEGEALLNDGAAIVVFKICLELLKSMTPFFRDQTALDTFQLIVQQSLLGPLIGWIMAKIGSFILQKIYNDALAEITITLSFTYITFYVGEVLKTSGVLGVVVFGIALDRSSITPQVDHFLHRFWEMLAYLANTLIFVIVGIIITQYIDKFTWADVGFLVMFYIGLTLIRTVSIFAFYPLMQRFGLELTWRHMVVMIWGGLRGAVGLALAVYLNSYAESLTRTMHIQDGNVTESVVPVRLLRSLQESVQDFPMNDTLEATDEELIYRNTISKLRINDNKTYEVFFITKGIEFDKIFLKILMHTGGIVLLTLVINASTIEAVLKKLGMLDVTHAQQVTMQNAVNRIQSNLKRTVNVLKFDRFLADAKWSLVDEMTRVEYPYKETPGMLRAMDEPSQLMLRISQSQDLTFKDLLEEARLRMIKALKMSYGKQYSHGLLSDQEARVLIAAADGAADKPGQFIDVNIVRKTWEVKGVLPYAKRKIEYWMYGRKSTSLTPPRNRQRRKIFKLVTSDKFEILMQCIIILNIIPIALDFVVDESWSNVETWFTVLEAVNFIFIGIYCFELLLKFIGLGGEQFIKSRWIQFDILIVMISFIEVIIDGLLVEGAFGGTNLVKTVKTTKVLRFSKVTKLIRTLRATRLLRLSKTIMPRVVNFINKLINKRLSFGYNVGKGFVTAEEEVNKLIGSICENRRIQKKLLSASDKNRLIVTKEMGLLQRDHPGIAISVKTRNAIRTVLNHSRDAIQQLCAGGVLDETEMQLLERGIEIQQKRLANFPSSVSPSDPEDILENILWVKDNPEILEFVKERAIQMDYDYGDVIIEEDEDFDGIHVIVHGMVKLVGTLHGHGSTVRPTSISQFHKPLLIKAAGEATILEEEETKEEAAVEEDFLGTGSIFGDVALLTQGQVTCNITCETAVQTYFLSNLDMEEAFRMFPTLKKTMWKVASIRIATPLYLEHFEYQGIGLEQIHLHLAQGYVVELNEMTTHFTFHESTVEASLIHGSVITKLTGEELEAPFLISPEYEEITLYNARFAILLVIPRETHTLDMSQNADYASRSRAGSRMFIETISRSASMSRQSVIKIPMFSNRLSVVVPMHEETETTHEGYLR